MNASAGAPPGSPGTPPNATAPPTPPPAIRRRRSRAGLVAAIVVVLIVVLVVVAGVRAGWFAAKGATKAGACPTDVTLQGAGANFVLPLLSNWSANFNHQTSNSVSYNPGGAGVGITSLTDVSVDFAVTDEPLNASQYAAMPSPVLTLPVTGGALAIVYNLPGLSTPLNVSGSVLADIYLGTITHWNDPAIAAENPGLASSLPNAPILTVHRSDAAGTTYVLTQYLSEDSGSWASGPGVGIQPSWPKAPAQVAVKGNSALAAEVKGTADTIGYVDLTDTLLDGLQYAAVQNPSGAYIRPTLANTASAIADISANTTFPAPSASWSNVSMVNAHGPADYPLATFSYLLVFQAIDKGYQATSVAKAQVLTEWVNWTVTTGQSYSSGLYYVPLPPAVVSLVHAAVGSMTFDGKAVPACSP